SPSSNLTSTTSALSVSNSTQATHCDSQHQPAKPITRMLLIAYPLTLLSLFAFAYYVWFSRAFGCQTTHILAALCVIIHILAMIYQRKFLARIHELRWEKAQGEKQRQQQGKEQQETEEAASALEHTQHQQPNNKSRANPQPTPLPQEPTTPPSNEPTTPPFVEAYFTYLAGFLAVNLFVYMFKPFGCANDQVLGLLSTVFLLGNGILQPIMLRRIREGQRQELLRMEQEQRERQEREKEGMKGGRRGRTKGVKGQAKRA
ncbi:hypothetical protein BJ508DRAFT_349248, partial [Ascobolus immersus RN42]